MQYGLCDLSVVALRSEASDKSELISQVLYGDYFKVLEAPKNHGVASGWDLINMKVGSITNSFGLLTNWNIKNCTSQNL
jgi:hypothetical protein